MALNWTDKSDGETLTAEEVNNIAHATESVEAVAADALNIATALSTGLGEEAATRFAADSELRETITAETAAREHADDSIRGRLPNIKKTPGADDGDVVDTHLTVGVRKVTDGAAYMVGSHSFVSGGKTNAPNRAQGDYSAIVGGTKNSATQNDSVVIGGYNNDAQGWRSAVIAGMGNLTTNNHAVTVGGQNNAARGDYAVTVGGQNNTCAGNWSLVLGGTENNTIGNCAAVIGGKGNASLANQVKMGHCADYGNAGTDTGTTGDAFIIGNGTVGANTNAFRVTYAGEVYAKAAFNSTGADYAECEEWLDGNPNAEDRVGRIVVFDGEYIRYATENDTDIRLMGVVSGAPSVVGDSYDDEWRGRYMRDKFNRLLTVTVHHDEVRDDEDNVLSEAYDAEEYITNPDYDPEREYIPQSERKEKCYVGTHGKLVVIDDGTCVPGGFCMPKGDGIGTAADDGFYVMSRIDESTVKVRVR